MSGSGDLLPHPADYEDFARLRGDPAVWLPALRVVCERHGLGADTLYAERTGTNVVFRSGTGPWIKLFAPLWPEDHGAERAGLLAAARVEGLQSPRCLAEGEIDGWPYLVIEHVEGRPVGEVWMDLPRAAQVDLAEDLGRTLARLHATRVEDPGVLARDWPAFVHGQRAACVAQHAEAGASAAWCEAITRFVGTSPPLFTRDVRPVFLHADVTDEHLLVAERSGHWRVTGLIDFGDAMMGHAPYEFAAPAVFLLQRRPAAQRALLRGYGYAERDLTPDFARRLTGYVLLHRFARLPAILRSCPPPRPRTMEDLRAALWDL